MSHDDVLLPPILSTPDLRVVGIGRLDDGRNYLKLATTGRSPHPVREIVIVVATGGELEYEYSIYDRSIAQIVTYRGRHGDPERDEWVSNRSLTPKQE
jgi:hypothetical protein